MAPALHSVLHMEDVAPAVLAVDDDADLLATYCRLLSPHGYRVVMALSRASGLVAVERERPRLVIADLRLRDGDGLDVVRAARQQVPPVPVIVVSGVIDERSRRAAQAVGVSAFLPKPFETTALVELVRTYVPIPPPTGGLH